MKHLIWFFAKYYIVYRGYDAKDKGRYNLVIEELSWKDNGPVVSAQQ